jgi:small GTP-binding protein
MSSTTNGSKTKYKIAFLGNQSVGKSSIIEKYINNRFSEESNVHSIAIQPTVGIDFLAKTVRYDSRSYRLQLWDTAGQERFKSLIPSYLKDAICAIIVYDVTNKQSLADADSWLQLYSENKTFEGYTVLVGNKIDLPNRY